MTSLITTFLSPHDDDAAVRVLYEYLTPSVAPGDDGIGVDPAIFIPRVLRLIHILAEGLAQSIVLQSLMAGVDPAETWAQALIATHGSGAVDKVWEGDMEGAIEAFERMIEDDND